MTGLEVMVNVLKEYDELISNMILDLLEHQEHLRSIAMPDDLTSERIQEEMEIKSSPR